MAKRYVTKDGVVVNTIELEDGAHWSPPSGYTLEPPGYTPPTPPATIEPESPIDAAKTKYADANTQAKKLDTIAEYLGIKDSE